MAMLIGFIFLIIFALVFNQICLWLERKGWLYYRYKKPQKGIIGTGLQELNAQLVPTHRHVVQAKQQKINCKKSEKDLPLDENKVRK